MVMSLFHLMFLLIPYQIQTFLILKPICFCLMSANIPSHHETVPCFWKHNCLGN